MGLHLEKVIDSASLNEENVDYVAYGRSPVNMKEHNGLSKEYDEKDV